MTAGATPARQRTALVHALVYEGRCRKRHACGAAPAGESEHRNRTTLEQLDFRTKLARTAELLQLKGRIKLDFPHIVKDVPA